MYISLLCIYVDVYILLESQMDSGLPICIYGHNGFNLLFHGGQTTSKIETGM